jgi:hypothetical protein
VEQQLPAGLGKGEIAELIQDDEVHAGQVIGKAALAGIASFGLETIDEVNHIVEPATGAGSNAASGDGNSKMRLTGTGAADQNGIALLGQDAPPARSRTSVSLMGVPSNWKSSRSLASGSLAIVSWYGLSAPASR